MSIDTLVAALEREAEERARALLGEATEQAREIRRRAREDVEGLRSSRLEEHRRRLEAEGARREADVDREIEEEVLTARAEFLERVFEGARKRLDRTLAAGAYRSVLPAHLEEALRFVDLETREADVVVPGELETVVGELLSHLAGGGAPPDGKLRVVVEPDAAPGVTVRTADGHVTVDNTLPGRLSRRRAVLAMRVVARVEEGG